MMLVDCTTCPVRDVHCADCMVTALTSLPIAPLQHGRPALAGSRAADADHASGEGDPGMPLDRAERRAVSVLLGAGLVTVHQANGARAVPTAASAHGSSPLQRQHRHTGTTGSSRAAG